MGKYMKKAKPRSEIALMDLSPTQSSTYLGVRTRAKTLALQKSQQLSSPSSTSYLQLRSRRLEKPPLSISSHDSSKRPRNQNPKSSSIPNCSRLRLGSVASEEEAKVEAKEEEEEEEEEKKKGIVHEHVDVDAAGVVEEASFGENVLDFEGRERSTRESTPCSLIRDPDTVRTPGSTTRPTCSTEAYRRTEHATRRQIPTAHEMDEFFAEAEEAQQRQFIEKYNFDPVNEKPLPGRYEWEKLES